LNCEDLLDSHLGLIDETVMEDSVSTTADHADQQVWNHTVLQRMRHTRKAVNNVSLHSM